MNRFSKSLLLVLAVCLLGALPASASAAGALYSGGSEVAVGTKVTGAGVTHPKFYSGATLLWECTGAKMAGTVAANGATNSITVEELALTGAGPEGECSGLGGFKASLKSPACLSYSGAGSWLYRGNACLTEAGSLRLIMVWNTGGTCEYSRGPSAQLGSNVNSEPLIVSQTASGAEFGKISGPAGCTASVTLKNLSLELTTAAGQGLKVIK